MRIFFMLILGLTIAFISSEVFADSFKKACENVETFFQRFETILRVVSVSVVTIAIVFAGYQIAFAHKRLSDVAPVLIGGLLIGGAAAIAGWFTTSWTDDTTSGATTTCSTASSP
jgi:type IV secretion system protein VirB2